MIDRFRRSELRRRGMSCGRSRRKHHDSPLLGWMSSSRTVQILAIIAPLVAIAILVLSAPGQPEALGSPRWKTLVAVAILGVSAVIHLYVNHPRTCTHNGRTALMFGLVLAQVTVTYTVIGAVESNGWPPGYRFLLAPYAIAPMALAVLMGRNHGIFAAVYASLWSSLMFEPEKSLSFLIHSLVVGLIGVYLTDQVSRRSRLLRAGLFVGLAAAAMALLLGEIELSAAISGQSKPWEPINQALIALSIGLLAAMVLSGSLPLLESASGITTDISWLEMADLNHPLMRRLSLEAPGTFHHSLVVASLSEAAAKSIGANAAMCRVCAYFHDVGKLAKPSYYTENQRGGQNPHDELTPTMSALVILSHVKDGVDMAIKHKLDDRIIDVIEQHHGTSLVYYFYRLALSQAEEAKHGSSPEMQPSEIAEDRFRYPGPKPQFPESAIISLADSVESASRSMEKPTPAKLEQLVVEIIRARIQDGQLDECELTLRELNLVQHSLVASLQNMNHERVPYNLAEQKETSQGGDSAARAKTGRPRDSSATARMN
jgi:cyclic-di-AMP phosphodiesterase PgpH